MIVLQRCVVCGGIRMDDTDAMTDGRGSYAHGACFRKTRSGATGGPSP
jgi:hypothetical protein